MRFRKRLCLKSATGNHDETRGLLSNPSLESLEIYVEGQYDKYNVVYWVKCNRPLGQGRMQLSPLTCT